MRSFADVASALNRSTVYLRGLQIRFALPVLDEIQAELQHPRRDRHAEVGVAPRMRSGFAWQSVLGNGCRSHITGKTVTIAKFWKNVLSRAITWYFSQT